MKKIILGSLALSFGTTAFAALPPHAESIRRLQEALRHTNALRWVESISAENSVFGRATIYTVKGDKCTMKVQVKCGALPPRTVGPCPLKTTATVPDCSEDN